MLSIQWQLLIVHEPEMPQPAELEQAAEVLYPKQTLQGVV
jgi:hypothetical protein